MTPPSTSRVLNDMEGWLVVRRKFFGKRRRQYIRLNGSVITAHANRKAPIEWDVSVQNAVCVHSIRRPSIQLNLSSGSKLYLQPESRNASPQWVSALRHASSRNFEDLYDMAEKIGEGAFASVHKAIRKRDGLVVAVKKIKKKQFDMQMARELEREMYTMKHVDHPALIKTHDVFNLQDKVLIVLDFMKGGTLKDNVQTAGGFIPEHCALPIIRDMLQACSYLHKNGYVHRDIKLENILCEDTRIPVSGIRLADFGYVNFVEHLTDTCLRSLVGTPVYVAPEIINRHDYGPQVDLYAIGVMLHRMLCGSYPYDAKDDDEKTMALAVQGHLTFADPAWKSISPSCKSFVRALLQPHPERRLIAKAALHHPWLSESKRVQPDRKMNNSPIKSSIIQDSSGTDGQPPSSAMSPVTPAESAKNSTQGEASDTIRGLITRFSAEVPYQPQRHGERLSSISEHASTVSKTTGTSPNTSSRRISVLVNGAAAVNHAKPKQILRKAAFASIFVSKINLLAGVRRARPRQAYHNTAATLGKERLGKERENTRMHGNMPSFEDTGRRGVPRTFHGGLGSNPFHTISGRVKRTLSMADP